MRANTNTQSGTGNAEGTVADNSADAQHNAAAPAAMPPPIPKRTLIGKLMTGRSFSESPPTKQPNGQNASTQQQQKQQSDDARKRGGLKQMGQHQSRRTTVNEPAYQNEQYSDDDRLSLESVFDEPKSSDPIIFSKSNRSSSDSNKSHGTSIDTGYMSSSTNDNDRIFFGPSEDFRARFSSVDTQSSLDSCLSSDSQTQQAFNQSYARCIISPLAVKRDEYEEYRQNPSKYGSRNGSNATIQSKLSNNLKVGHNVAANDANRGGSRMSNNYRKPPSPLITPSANCTGRPRPPPAPQIQQQSSLDSGKIFHNGSMLGAFQSGIAKITEAATLTSEAVIGRKITNAARQLSLGGGSNNQNAQKNNNAAASNGPPSKMTYRQDSTISSDSFSMTSSPGFNTKNMEAPLLQHASRINRNNCVSGNETGDSFSMTSRYLHGIGGGNGARGTVRQDSSDSFSQTSSPGYNTKMSEQPLLAHAIKINASKWSTMPTWRQAQRVYTDF